MPSRSESGRVTGTYKRPPKKKRTAPASQGHPSRGGVTVGGGTGGRKPTRYHSPTPAPKAPATKTKTTAPKPDVTLGGDRRPKRSGHKRATVSPEAKRARKVYSRLRGSKAAHPTHPLSVEEQSNLDIAAEMTRYKRERERFAERAGMTRHLDLGDLDELGADALDALKDSAKRQLARTPIIAATEAGKRAQPKALRRELEGQGELAKLGEKLKKSNILSINAPRGGHTSSASLAPPIVGAAARDAIDLATNAVPSTYMSADAIVAAAKGDPEKVQKLWDDFKKTSAIPEAVQGHFKEALKRAKAHPLITAAELSGAKAIVGRGTGAAARRVPGKNRASRKVRKAASQERADLHLYPKGLGGPKVERRYSPDLINKAVQVLSEKTARKEVKVRGRTIKRARDPEVDRGRPSLSLDEPRTRRRLLRQVDTRVHGQEGIRRSRREKVARETIDTIPPREIPAAARRVTVNRSAKGVSDRLAFFMAEGTVRTPKTWRGDLEKRLGALRESLPEAKRRSREHAKKNQAEQQMIEALLTDKKLTPKRVEKTYAAALKFAVQEHGRQTRLQESAQYTREQEQSRLMPVAQAHMGGKPALERRKTTEQIRFEQLRDQERQAAAELRKVGRRLEGRKTRAARIQGAAEVRVGQADRALLEGDPKYVAARKELTRASNEFTAANRALRNAEANGSDPVLAAARVRHKAARAAATAARKAVKQEVARATVGPNAVGRRPIGTLRSLEKAKGLEGEAELQLGRAVKHFEGVRKARQEAKVPKGKRTYQPWLLDDKGREITPSEVEAFLRESGRDPQSVALISQRPVKTKSTAYVPTTRDGTSPPSPPSKRRTGTAYELGARDVGAEPMLRQALFSESQATAVENFKRLVGEFGVYPRKNKGFETDYDRAVTIGRELVDEDLPPFVPVNVAHLYAAGKLLEEARRTTRAAEPDKVVIETLSDTVRAAFQRPPDGRGQFVLMPADVVKRLQQHNFTLTSVEQYTQSISNLWKDNVLTTASPATWLANNVMDLGMRSLFAGIGPLSVIRGKGIVKRAAEINKRRGEEISESLTGGSLYGASERANVHRATRVGSNKVGRAAAAPWRTWRDSIYHLEQHIERLPQYGAVGKAAAHDIQMKRSLKGLLKVTDEQMQDYAHGITSSPAKEARIQKAVEDVVGRWGKVSPSMRRTLGLAPFAQWLFAALRYVYVTLPAHHPIKTGFGVAMYEATEKQRKGAGLSTEIPVKDRLLSYLQGGVSLSPDNAKTDKEVEGEILRLQRAFSFGTAAGVATNWQEFAVSQFRSPALAAMGVGWNGDQLVYPDGHPRAGRPLSAEDKAAASAGLLVEGFIPFSSMFRKVVLERGRTADPASTILDVKTRPKWDPSKKRYVQGPAGSIVPEILDWLNPIKKAKPYRERDIDAILAAKRRGQTFDELRNRKPKTLEEEFEEYRQELKSGDPGGVKQEFQDFLKERR